jgi:2-oxoglutarate ferredoxin oxidoreductase subunit alpha
VQAKCYGNVIFCDFGGKTRMSEKLLMKGNEAVGEGAILAGCRHYFGYPITPQNELTAYMGKRMMEVGGTFIQSESELAAINMVFGAAAAGARAMTTSSSPGVSLMQEGISYLAGCELPAVIANVVRGGPGLGSIGPAQSDYFQAVKGGGHGDYRNIVLAPSNVQEMLDLTMLAFDLADEYRNPAIVLTDGLLGQMMEPVAIPDNPKPKKIEKPWALTGCRGREPNHIKSLYLDNDLLEDLNRRLQEKYRKIFERERRYEYFKTDGSLEVLIVAYGSAARIAKEAVVQARAAGRRVGLIRPITLFPFTEPELLHVANNAQSILVVELSCGQMIEDVRLTVGNDKRIDFCGRSGGNVISSKEILAALK